VSSSKRKNEQALKEVRDELEIRVPERNCRAPAGKCRVTGEQAQILLLTEAIPQQLWSTTPNGSIDYCNQRMLDYLGRGIDDMRGESLSEIIHL
jgi:PAS domain-containing protein